MIYNPKLIEQLSLYFVCGSLNSLKDIENTIRDAIMGGVTMVQYREKGEGAYIGEEKVIVAQKIKTICEQFSVPFIVNDDLQLATILDADGLHVGQEDGDLIDIRNRWDGILGISTHNVKEAQDAQKVGADYIGVGPMYPSISKEDHAEVKGPMIIKEIRNAGIRMPLVGIGGINQENMRNVMEVGADGVAVISAISRASSPLQAALELSAKMKRVKKEI